jgi:hypothetical protein
MCCRIEISPLVPEIAEAQLAIGQFTFDPTTQRWQRKIEEENTTVMAVFSGDRLCLSLTPTISHYSHHFGKRLAIGVYLEMAARYGEKVGGLVEQLSNVTGCSESGIARKQLAWYPTIPLDFNRVCQGFRDVIEGGHYHGADEDEPIATG